MTCLSFKWQQSNKGYINKNFTSGKFSIPYRATRNYRIKSSSSKIFLEQCKLMKINAFDFFVFHFCGEYSRQQLRKPTESLLELLLQTCLRNYQRESKATLDFIKNQCQEGAIHFQATGCIFLAQSKSFKPDEQIYNGNRILIKFSENNSTSVTINKMKERHMTNLVIGEISMIIWIFFVLKMLKFLRKTPIRPLLSRQLIFLFSFPKHDVLAMPALSPTMKEGKILKWLVKEGDKVQPGDAIAQVETDKATIGFQVQEKGYIAKINEQTGFIPIGDPVAVLTKKADEVQKFSSYAFGASQPSAESSNIKQTPPAPSESKVPSKDYPKHSFLQMPAVSPTMTEGKILKWKIQPGDSFGVGDALFSIETDKAVVDYEATEKGVLAKIIAESNQALPIGTDVAVVVKKKEQVSSFSDFQPQPSGSSASSASSDSPKAPPSTAQPASGATHESAPLNSRLASSPLAKAFAKRHGVDIAEIQGSGPGGRVIKQDVEDRMNSGSVAAKPKQEQIQKEEPVKVDKKVTQKRPVLPENPFEEIQLTGMRKTIASRLTESKQNIPHYYVTQSIQMDAITALRSDFNKREKENGVKISVNDIILKAMALALRDVPDANVQWHGNFIRKFKHSDISVAVAVEGGLITPVVSRAETLGLIELAKKTKDIVKRARQGKLDPNEYIGGTATISNLGMYGINTVSSIINPPQSIILGVGKTEERVLPSSGPERIRIAQVMDVIASCDHRAVDGALCSQWLNRIKFYLENPVNMLL